MLTGATIVTREPDWDEESRMWALALTEREAGECKRCGGDLNETLDYAFKWNPLPPSVCLRCVALHEDEQRHRKSPYAAGMIHTVRKAPRPQPKRRKRR